MKKWTKVLLSTALLGAVVVIAGACGNKEKAVDTKSSKGDKENIELKVTTWNYETTPEFEALFRAFEKENPGVKVSPVDIASDDYDTKITTMMSSGDETDIITMKNLLSYSGYAMRNQLVDVTDHIKDLDTKAAKESYDMFDIDGKTYAQPYRTDFWVLYYNKKMFDDKKIEYPVNLTWEEYEKVAKDLTDTDTGQFGAYQHTWRSVVQAMSAAQNDKNLTKAKYEFLKEDYDRVLRMQDDKSIMDYGTAKSTGVTYASQFESSKAAMMPMGSWYMAGVLANKDAGKTDVDWAIAPVPQKKKGENTTFGSPTAFAINKNAKNQEMAQKFLDFASGEKGAKVLAEVGVVPSYRTDAINKLYFSKKGMPTDEASQKAFNPDTIRVEFPVDKNGSAIDKILQEEHELILVGDSTPEKGIASMEKRVAQEIK
ncbi:ABC transporter substrate-binding protein [Vagococcus silagei]|uniref:Sugar ABC transporter substrate-binding protein n=1 Tax=Vagococcus silagei TaxID=2508885 RepID=A0A4V3TV13_9ENTE|nr:sugar ABC transporter substrate-binding protein [Vagococcus silagei]THB61189.1 sugar ABC transporter substrate-binding protein [Vagococcus silagei]